MSLTDTLTRQLDSAVWVPGPLERVLARRLVAACAGTGQPTADHVRDTLRDGSVSLTYAGDGRLAQLLGRLFDVVAAPREAGSGSERADGHSPSAVLRLLARVAESGGTEGEGSLRS